MSFGPHGDARGLLRARSNSSGSGVGAGVGGGVKRIFMNRARPSGKRSAAFPKWRVYAIYTVALRAAAAASRKETEKKLLLLFPAETGRPAARGDPPPVYVLR